MSTGPATCRRRSSKPETRSAETWLCRGSSSTNSTLHRAYRRAAQIATLKPTMSTDEAGISNRAFLRRSGSPPAIAADDARTHRQSRPAAGDDKADGGSGQARKCGSRNRQRGGKHGGHRQAGHEHQGRRGSRLIGSQHEEGGDRHRDRCCRAKPLRRAR